MKITPEQIQLLYTFTKQHFVEYYDLQTELVDHLANAIEERWAENPKLDFDEALGREFKKFGIFGFSDVVEKRSMALSKKYFFLVLKHFKEFFRIPKIILTLFLIFMVYQLMVFVPYKNSVFIGSFVLIFLLAIVKMVQSNKKYKTKVKTTGKKWMFEELLMRFGNFPLMFMLLFNILNSMIRFASAKPIQPENTTIILIFSAVLVLLGMLSYVIFFVIPQKAEQYLAEHYPEYMLS